LNEDKDTKKRKEIILKRETRYKQNSKEEVEEFSSYEVKNKEKKIKRKERQLQLKL
jgi:hypothetical protein